MQNAKNTNEWVNWIEESISKEYYRLYEQKHFSKIQKVGTGGFGKVYRASWKNSQYFALKSFFNLDDVTAKEIVHEIKLQRDIQFHNNIIKFYGIAKFDPENDDVQSKNYLLVMEYADSGPLKNYLKENFNNLTWNDKYNLAYQLACAVLCLHNEGIVHRDLHSEDEKYDVDLAIEISQGLREELISNTPEDYIKIYTECWNGEPDNRPTINQLMKEKNLH
ncbi:unnamed protein product [Rhizophagus irregularis]|uniref:Protein kinase domain-containing protein n=1 Tax=Rhizophagus irregularis TaxID=588596 RepID=A0A915ZVL1_9GLOM|nr:unnamed protein product [Rhizophagus irregularis]CAB5392926.1 unnamed protein product [Rhizophagus irregularis]